MINGQMNIDHLKTQRNLLVTQVDNYILLRHQVELSELLGKVMVLIGDGYFVEKTVAQAQAFLDRRIDSLSEIITRFNTTINREEEFTLRDDAMSDKILEKLKLDEKYNEEGLPFIDIVEQLDDEDNIVSVKVGDSASAKPSKIDELSVASKNSSQSERDRDENDISNPNNNTTLDTELPVMDIVEQLDDDDTIVSVKINNVEKDIPKEVKKEVKSKSTKEKMTQAMDSPGLVDIIEELDEDGNIINTQVQNSREFINKTTQDQANESEEDQFQELLQDMEVVGTKKIANQSELLSKIEELDVSTEDKSKIKLLIINGESPNQDNITEDVQERPDPDFDYKERVPKDHITIERKDLLELEMLADEFNDEDDLEEDGDYEFEFDNEDDAEEEEDDDSDYDEAKFFGNNKMNDMLWQQINQLRSTKVSETKSDKVEEIEKEVDAKELAVAKKEVRFNDQLDILEIESIKNEDYEEPKRISRFKQVRERENGKTSKPAMQEDIPVVADVIEGPVSDIIERQVIEIDDDQGNLAELDAIQSSIIEENVILSDVIEKDVIHTDIIEKDVIISESIIKNDNQQENQPAPKKVSRFKQSRSSESEPVVSDIIERPVEHSVEHSIEPEIQDQTSSDLMDMIKAYNLENDAIEGPVIKNLHDIKQLNEMHEQLDVDSYEIVGEDEHNHEHNHEHSHDHGLILNSEHEEIEISEKETTVTGDLADVMEQDNLEEQIKREYFSIKDKLMVPEAEKEFETDFKPSKFRQRLHR